MFIPIGNQFYYHAANPAVLRAVNQRPQYQPPRLARPALVRGRTAVRRSADLFRRFHSEEALRDFLGGKTLTLHGRRFDYRIRKHGISMLSDALHPATGHVPFDLALVTKDGRKIAQGCVVTPGAPVLDQLLALSLHVQDNDEELTLLRTTNWSPRLAEPERMLLAA